LPDTRETRFRSAAGSRRACRLPTHTGLANEVATNLLNRTSCHTHLAAGHSEVRRLPQMTSIRPRRVPVSYGFRDNASMDKTRWWGQWYARTGLLACIALTLILLWVFLSPARFRGAGTTVEHVAAAIATFATAASGLGHVVKWMLGKPAPGAKQTDHTQPTARPVDSRQAPRRNPGLKPTSTKSGGRASTDPLKVVIVALKMLWGIGTLALLAAIWLFSMCVPAAVGWAFGGHGVHLLGDHLRNVNIIFFWFGL
jgi:hypothetical protein